MMPISLRKRAEPILLAILAIASIMPLRLFVESTFWISAEIGTMLISFAVAIVTRDRENQAKSRRLVHRLALAFLAITPVLFAIGARAFGSPIPFEISALTTFGAISLAIATGASNQRIQSLALITSGFLVLFNASISDDQSAVAFPLVWMLGCVWHLVANHWERLDLALPDSVERSWAMRPGVVLATVLVLAVGGYSVHGQASASKRLAFGLMPTSGGSVWSDPAARSGVGSGDAAIAAKDHAESFGAVDSDIFLESTESSLFDMVNDLFGEPKKKSKWERRQAMANSNVIEMHDKTAKSEKGGGTFSTERLPPKKHRHFNDSKDNSVVQWDGPTGIRLAMHRYDTFDGSQWSQTEDLSNEKLTRVDVNEAPWFFNPIERSFLDPEAVSVGLLKVIRLDSQRLPVPMMTAGVHIKQVDRQDFYGLAKDGSFLMPGRERVPPLTVVHVASSTISEDHIRKELLASDVPRPSLINSDDSKGVLTASARMELQSIAANAVAEHADPYDQLLACMATLRNEYAVQRDGEAAATSLSEFLETRRGGGHLFATSAALLARQLGFRSRLVTGMYVRPDAYDITAGHASVSPGDVHAWAEVQLNNQRWIEIEPTPGYLPPDYRPSWWLVSRRFAEASWPTFLGSVFFLGIAFLTRRFWIDWTLLVTWSLSRWLQPRRQVRLALRIIETRARLAGQRRPDGTSQRAWLEQLTKADVKIANAARKFCDAADALCFGHGGEDAAAFSGGLVNLLRIQTITELNREATS